ncbi:protein FAR1-RELATED SEQUENCE 5-like [Carex rostrata]
MELSVGVNWIPRVDMEFNTAKEAWDFWVNYGSTMGFNVRKHWTNRSRTGEITSQTFVCSSEGFRKKDKRYDFNDARAETRTGCAVRMGIKLIRGTQRYHVVEFISGHNHELRRGEVTEGSGSDTEPDGPVNVDFTCVDEKNYLRGKSQGALFYGDAVSLLSFFKRQDLDNPDFLHVELLDGENRIVSVFWADSKMLSDYAHFGDVVTFDTTYCRNKEFRPFGVFVGLNHFREAIVFGAVLLYDKSVESFEWLFNTFLETHKGKKPVTIITDQDLAMVQAIGNVMPGTVHVFCAWQIMETATKHLGLELIDAFRVCLYELEQEVEFEAAFTDLIIKTNGNTWLASLYNDRKQWAYCFVKNLFSLGMRNTQPCESLNKALHNYLKSDVNIIGFFKHFEKVVNEVREKEIVLAHEKPIIKVKAPILHQTSKLYTPRAFQIFQDEYELSVAALIEGLSDNNYSIRISDLDDAYRSDKSYKVFGNPVNETISCSCYKFESFGLLCCHALKVLDAMNIKRLPEKYILKRWTNEANKDMVEDTKLIAARRKWELCRKFTEIASKAVGSEQLSTLVDSTLHTLGRQVDGLDMILVPGNVQNPARKRHSSEIIGGKRVRERNDGLVQKAQNTDGRKATGEREGTGGSKRSTAKHL